MAQNHGRMGKSTLKVWESWKYMEIMRKNMVKIRDITSQDYDIAYDTEMINGLF